MLQSAYIVFRLFTMGSAKGFSVEKVLAARPEDLSSIRRICMVEDEKN